MSIAVRYEDPVLAASIANKISELFIRHNNLSNQSSLKICLLPPESDEKKQQLNAVMEKHGDFLQQPEPGTAGARDLQAPGARVLLQSRRATS